MLRTVVGLRPGDRLPLDVDLVAGFHGGMAAGRLGLLVADDGIGRRFFRRHEAVAQVGRLPAHADRGVRVIGVFAGEPASIVDAVDNNVGDIPVRRGTGNAREESKKHRRSAGALHGDQCFGRIFSCGYGWKSKRREREETC